jgi:hypothetical protein
MREVNGFAPKPHRPCGIAKTLIWIFGQLFFGSFFFCKKKEQNKKRDF